ICENVNRVRVNGSVQVDTVCVDMDYVDEIDVHKHDYNTFSDLINEPKMEAMRERFKNSLVKFMWCMGWEWCTECMGSALKCAIVVKPRACIEDIICDGTSAGHCTYVLEDHHYHLSANMLNNANVDHDDKAGGKGEHVDDVILEAEMVYDPYATTETPLPVLNNKTDTEKLIEVLRDPKMKEMRKRYRRSLVKFMWCMGWKWCSRCLWYTIECALMVSARVCIQDIKCGGTSTLKCTGLLEDHDYKGVDNVFHANHIDKRNVYQRAFNFAHDDKRTVSQRYLGEKIDQAKPTIKNVEYNGSVQYERICTDMDYVDNSDVKIYDYKNFQDLLNDPEMEALKKRFGQSLVKFLWCKGWKWCKNCAWNMFKCATVLDVFACIGAIVCGPMGTLRCTGILKDYDYNPLENVFAANSSDKRNLYQR
ncbi:unnamed protein product, partial [Medioppia subpectinata]